MKIFSRNTEIGAEIAQQMSEESESVPLEKGTENRAEIIGNSKVRDKLAMTWFERTKIGLRAFAADKITNEVHSLVPGMDIVVPLKRARTGIHEVHGEGIDSLGRTLSVLSGGANLAMYSLFASGRYGAGVAASGVAHAATYGYQAYVEFKKNFPDEYEAMSKAVQGVPAATLEVGKRMVEAYERVPALRGHGLNLLSEHLAEANE